MELGKPMVIYTYSKADQCGFSAGAFSSFPPEATLGWKVTITPRRIGTDDAVVAINWERTRRANVEAQGSGELLLRRGDSAPIDLASMMGLPKPAACSMTTAEAVVEFDPVDHKKYQPGMGTVVSTDMWLVRTLASGVEETQRINVRGAFNESVPFYFEDIKSDAVSMSVLGNVRARDRGNGVIDLDFSVERQFHAGAVELGRGFSSAYPNDRLIRFDSANSVVSVEFPLSAAQKLNGLGNDKLSIRMKTRQIR
jgi:hypothetical protein